MRTKEGLVRLITGTIISIFQCREIEQNNNALKAAEEIIEALEEERNLSMPPLQVMDYKGYMGSAMVSIDDNCLYGRIIGVKDIITYQSDTVPTLKKEFEIAVDDYIDTIEALGWGDKNVL